MLNSTRISVRAGADSMHSSIDLHSSCTYSTPSAAIPAPLTALLLAGDGQPTCSRQDFDFDLAEAWDLADEFRVYLAVMASGAVASDGAGGCCTTARIAPYTSVNTPPGSYIPYIDNQRTA